MKNILPAFFLFFTIQTWGQESSAFLITNEGERVEILGRIELGAQTLTVMNPDSKAKTFTQSKLKMMVMNDRLWITLPIRGTKMPRLQEVIAWNDKYILTCFRQNSTTDYILVFDWDKTIREPHELAKLDQKFMNEFVSPYFKECPDLMDRLKQNIANKKEAHSLIDGISLFQCGNRDIFDLLKE